MGDWLEGLFLGTDDPPGKPNPTWVEKLQTLGSTDAGWPTSIKTTKFTTIALASHLLHWNRRIYFLFMLSWHEGSFDS